MDWLHQIENLTLYLVEGIRAKFFGQCVNMANFSLQDKFL